MKIFNLIKLAVLCGAVLGVASCGSSSPNVTDPPEKQAAAIRDQGGVYKVGNPYKILGRWYYPKEDYKYKEVGTASWYGPDFHAKRTANGEKYDMHALTAAHRTLPLPSIVRVTNLENGRSLLVRVNDRGPYARNRIIDISKKGAQLLGFLEQGTAKVRVEVLEKESKNLKAALTGSPLYADVTAAPVTKIEAGNIMPIAGSAIAEPKVVASAPTQAAAEIEYNNFVPDYSYEPEERTSQASKGGFYVQAGAFAAKDAADNLSARLSNLGRSAVTAAEVNGKLFYRVRIGPYADHSQALQAQAQLRNYGVSSAHIIEE